MRSRNLAVLVLVAMTMFVTDALSLDLRGALRSAAGQVINNAVRGSSPAPQQYQSYQQPQQQTQSYTYEEYMAAQGGGDAAAAAAIAVPQDAVSQAEDDYDPENPFAGLVEDDDDQPSANAGKGAGGQEGGTIEVVATGIGTNSDQALKNALRAAIEQAVGTMVDSETLAQNDEVINDQILSYSAGIVESHKMIGEPRTRDGLVTIKIQAQVKRTELTAKLKAASIHVKEVDGESLFGEVFTALEQEQNASEMIKKQLEGFPENLLEIKMAGKPRYNRENKKVQIEVEISINQERYRSFTKGILPILKKSASNHQEVNGRVEVNSGDVSTEITNEIIMGSYNRTNKIAVCTQMNDARTNSKWNVFDMSQDVINSIHQSLKRPTFTVDIVDESGDSIVSGRYNSPIPYRMFEDEIAVAIFPLLDNNISWAPTLRPGTVSVKMKLEFDVSIEEMKRMRNVVCKIIKG